MIQGSRSQKILVAVLFVFFTFLIISNSNDSSETDDIKAENRTGQVLFKNKDADAEGMPFIASVKVISEAQSKVVFDVRYFLPRALEGTYNVSLHPDTSEWAQSIADMKAGLNSVQISVSFKPGHIGKTRSKSNVLRLYINQYEDQRYVGEVFDRTLTFEKIWMK